MIRVFHLVNLRMWPFVTTLVVIEMSMLAFVSIKYGLTRPLANLIFISLLIMWFKDVMRERDLEVNHGHTRNTFLKPGIILFTSSEIIFFVSFFRCYPDPVMVVDFELGVWPSKGILRIRPPRVPLLNTLILLSSGVFTTWTHPRTLSRNWFTRLVTPVRTLVLGVYSLKIQHTEYGEVSFSFIRRGYGRIFFLATGFHGFHAILGCITTSVRCLRILDLKIDGVRHYNFEFSAWHWHLADVVRLLLFVSTYWWGSQCDRFQLIFLFRHQFL